MSLNVDSNAYTLGFATIIVVGVALMLSSLSVSLKERSKANVILDNKYSILKSVDKSITKADADKLFDDNVESFIVNYKGETRKAEQMEVFDIKIKDQLKKEVNQREVPLYIMKGEKGNRYILPMRGNGLWDEIWGYMALESDVNTVRGVSFDHAGETPGLGAEITKDWFMNNFAEEQIFDKSGNFVGINVLKGKNNPANAEMHKVDGMSGATITGDGVEDMITKSFEAYLPYLKKQKG